MCVAREADAEERRAFREAMASVDTGERRRIFVDETGCNLNLARRHGRAPRGVRLVERTAPRNSPPNRSLGGSLVPRRTAHHHGGGRGRGRRRFFRLPARRLGSAPAAW